MNLNCGSKLFCVFKIKCILKFWNQFVSKLQEGGKRECNKLKETSTNINWTLISETKTPYFKAM